MNKGPFYEINREFRKARRDAIKTAIECERMCRKLRRAMTSLKVLAKRTPSLKKYKSTRGLARWKIDGRSEHKRIANNLRSRLSFLVTKNGGTKAASTSILLGCSIEFLRVHLESGFKPGMSWDNYGDWHIDHVRPCKAFDLAVPEQQKACFHWTNLQPLWAEENMRKSGKIIQFKAAA